MATKKKNKGLLLLLLLIPIGLLARKVILNKMSKAFPLPPEPKKKKPAEIIIEEEKPKGTYKKAIVNVGSGKLNIRQNINTTADILARIPNGAILGYQSTGNADWVSVRWPNLVDGGYNTGFASTKYLKLTNDSYILK